LKLILSYIRIEQPGSSLGTAAVEVLSPRFRSEIAYVTAGIAERGGCDVAVLDLKTLNTQRTLIARDSLINMGSDYELVPIDEFDALLVDTPT